MPELYDSVTKKSYPLDGVDELYIGRTAPEGHLRTLLGLNTVSKRHARVFKRKGQFWIEDLGSTYGTWLDEIKLKVPLALEDESRIDLGAINYYSIFYYKEKRPEEGKKPEPLDDDDLLEEDKELSEKDFLKLVMSDQ